MEIVNIPALYVRRRIVIPAFRIDTDVSKYGATPLDAYRNAPTAAQLRHAYEKEPSIKKNIRRNWGTGEFLATFVRNGEEIYERPDDVYFDDSNGWVVRGVPKKRKLPPPGWVLECDKSDGLPLETTLEKKKAVKLFGDEAWHFSYSPSGLFAVARWHGASDKEGGKELPDSTAEEEQDNMDYHPFNLNADWLPNGQFEHIGVRRVYSP